MGGEIFENIQQYLDAARRYPTGRHWVDNFLLPTLLIHQFERAGREEKVNLKLLTLKPIMKYFFLAGHVHYAHYFTQYLLEMASLPCNVKDNLVCRHHSGYWNNVSADQFSEQTAFKREKGGLERITLSAELLVCR